MDEERLDRKLMYGESKEDRVVATEMELENMMMMMYILVCCA